MSLRSRVAGIDAPLFGLCGYEPLVVMLCMAVNIPSAPLLAGCARAMHRQQIRPYCGAVVDDSRFLIHVARKSPITCYTDAIYVLSACHPYEYANYMVALVWLDACRGHRC